jgi:hypothetical protein
MYPQLRYFFHLALCIGALAIALSIGGAVLSEPLTAQTITVRMLNGKTGKPLSNKNVTLRWSPHFDPPGSVVNSGKDGVATAEVPLGAKMFWVMGGPKVGNDPNRIPYINCNAPMEMTLQVEQVLKNGYVPGNTCSKKSAVSRPGEIVFWAMPKPWWQPDMQ